MEVSAELDCPLPKKDVQEQQNLADDRPCRDDPKALAQTPNHATEHRDDFLTDERREGNGDVYR